MKTASLLLVACAALLVGACGGPVRPLPREGAAQGEPAERAVQVLVVELHGKMGAPEFAQCHRALRESAESVSWVVFDFDSVGDIAESPRDTEALFDHLVAARAKTIAYVRGKILGGAAHAALGCDRIYCAPGAGILGFGPRDAPLEEILGLAPEDAARQRLLAFRKQVRERVEWRNDKRERKLRPDALQLCEALADPSMQMVRVVVREDNVEVTRIVEAAEIERLAAQGKRVVEQTPFPRPLSLTAAEAEDCGLSMGTVQSMEQLCTDVLQVDRGAVGVLAVNWAEHMVGWLEWMQPFLFAIGFLLLLVEVKTPGFGLPGVLGIGLLGLAMFYSWLVGLAEVTEILLFFLGVASLAVEIFLLPGTILFGAVGFASLLIALILSQQSFVIPSSPIEEDILLQNLVNLTLLIVSVLVSGAMLWRVLPRLPLFRNALLAPPVPAAATAPGGLAASQELLALVGRTTRATTVLRPSGVVEIDGQRLDAVAGGEFIEAGDEVRVVAVLRGQLVVERTGPADLRGGGRAGERGSVGFVILLVVLGLAILVCEVLFVSFGVLSIFAGSALIGAVFLAFQEGNTFGTWVLISEAILAPIVLFLAFRILPRTAMGKALILDAPTHDQVTATDPAQLALLHKTGVTVSPLRPAGYARIDGRRTDVLTRGELLDEGVDVKVIEVTGNRVVVAALRPADSAPNRTNP